MPVIEKVLRSTGFIEAVSDTFSEDQENTPVVKQEPLEHKPSNKKSPEEKTDTDNKKESETQKTTEKNTTTSDEKPKTTPSSQETKPKEEQQNYKIRRSKLYFSKVEPEGNIRLTSIIRRVKFQDAPLTSTVEALIEGPTDDELNKNIISLIPDNTKLKSAWMNDNTAVLNFNEAFKFNSLGLEGYQLQIQQIVYTATEFSTVKQVQFLIEEEKHEYLGAEGMYIGKPLSRNSF